MKETAASRRYQGRFSTSGSKASGTKRKGLTSVPKTSAAAIAVVQGTATGDLEEASRLIGRARLDAERLGAGHHATFAKLCEGVVALERGDAEAARVLIEEATAAFFDQGNTVHFGWSRVVLARALEKLGRHDDAEREAGEGALFLEAVPVLRAACDASELPRLPAVPWR